MNIEELKQIIESSELSEPAKREILALLPNAEDAKVAQQIMDILKLDVVVAETAADQLEELYLETAMAEKQIQALDEFEGQQANKVIREFAEIEEVLQDSV